MNNLFRSLLVVVVLCSTAVAAKPQLPKDPVLRNTIALFRYERWAMQSEEHRQNILAKDFLKQTLSYYYEQSFYDRLNSLAPELTEARLQVYNDFVYAVQEYGYLPQKQEACFLSLSQKNYSSDILPVFDFYIPQEDPCFPIPGELEPYGDQGKYIPPAKQKPNHGEQPLNNGRGGGGSNGGIGRH